jgi:hypothetical protein
VITRFRIEGKKPEKQELIDFLAEQGAHVIGLLDQNGEWECTEDVITRIKDNHEPGVYHGYRGRMAFLFHPNGHE